MATTQPGRGDVHVNRPLTNISIAYMQAAESFIAAKVFPIIPVESKSDSYYIYDRGEFNRDTMEERAPSAESSGSGYKQSTENYDARIYSEHKDVPDQVRANADSPLSPDRDATMFLTQKAMIKRERTWVDKYLKDGVWTYSADGAAARSSAFNAIANNDLIYWSSDSSTPIEDIRLLRRIVQESNGGFRPNVLTIGRPVYDVLVDHADIIARLDRGQTPVGPAMAMKESLAALFELDEVLVMDSVYNSANEGATDVHTFIGGKNGLLSYRPASPGILTASAGYTFTWRGYLGAGRDGMRIKRFRMEELESDRVEISMAYDQKITGKELGVFIDDIVE